MVLKSLARAAAAIAGATLAVWAARLRAHAEVPPPEGHWREVTPDELGDG